MDKQEAMDRGLHPFVGPPTTFAAAFPTIATLVITLEIREQGSTQPDPSTGFYSLDNPPGEFIRCPRGSSCRNGGWHVADIIRDMVSKRESSRQARGTCEGQEPMGRGSFRRCKSYFTADIRLTFHEQQEAAQGT